jgi:hypothetical protein
MNRSNPNRIDLIWIGLDDFLKTNQTKPNTFYLAVMMNFMLKFKPNRTLIGRLGLFPPLSR